MPCTSVLVQLLSFRILIIPVNLIPVLARSPGMSTGPDSEVAETAHHIPTKKTTADALNSLSSNSLLQGTQISFTPPPGWKDSDDDDTNGEDGTDDKHPTHTSTGMLITVVLAAALLATFATAVGKRLQSMSESQSLSGTTTPSTVAGGDSEHRGRSAETSPNIVNDGNELLPV